MTASHVPTPFNGCNMYMMFDDVDAAIAFYKEAFHATEILRLTNPDGSAAHAELVIAGTTVMLGKAMPQCGKQSARTLGGSPISLCVYVKDVAQSFERAKRAGMEEVQPIDDMFWGDKMGSLRDPFGYEWGILQHVRKVSPEEAQNGFNKMIAEMENAA